jgi:hypothetical protein
VLAKPVSFGALYGQYGDSWRIGPADSLLSKFCGDRNVERRNPATPFYAQNLDARTRRRAQAVCTAAKVRDPALLDACTLDIAVTGNRTAAAPFTRTAPPRAVLRAAR